MTDRGAIGAVGTISIPTRGGNGPGEVVLTVGGVRECYIADSDAPIGRGQVVLVIDVAPHRHVTVVPWTDFPVDNFSLPGQLLPDHLLPDHLLPDHLLPEGHS